MSWQEWYDSLTIWQKLARWWSIHWSPLLALAALLAAMSLIGWWLG